MKYKINGSEKILMSAKQKQGRMMNMSKMHAHFDNMYNAGKTLAALKKMGIGNVYIDLAGAFDYEYSTELNTADTSDAPNLSALVLTSGGRLVDIDKAPHSTAVSGMACVEGCGDVSARLSVKIEDIDSERVSKVIRDNGGRIFKSFIE